MPVIGSVADAESARARDRLAGYLRPLWREGAEMILADSSYPLLNLFWSMFIFFLWIIWIWILIMVFIDIFRSHDLGGFAKALWFLFVLFIPLIGVLVYLIARGGKMHERAVQQAQQQDAEARAYIQQTAANAPASTADQLAKLADLRDRGVISAEEFEREKAKVLAAA
jgi:ABC-type multidrug transport system fused ATPase/permease subunit